MAHGAVFNADSDNVAIGTGIYPATDGTVAIWIRFTPTWDHDDNAAHGLFSVESGSNYVHVYKHTDNTLYVGWHTGGNDRYIAVTSANYAINDSTTHTLVWCSATSGGSTTQTLWLDGTQIGTRTDSFTPPNIDATAQAGRANFYSKALDGTLHHIAMTRGVVPSADQRAAFHAEERPPRTAYPSYFLNLRWRYKDMWNTGTVVTNNGTTLADSARAPAAVDANRWGPHWYEPESSRLDPDDYNGEDLVDAVAEAKADGRGKVMFPGKFNLATTADFGAIGPVEVCGAASAEFDGSGNEANSCRITWIGDADSVMFKLAPRGGWWHDFGLDGGGISGVTGILLYYEVGWGTADCVFDRIRLRRMHRFFQAGQATGNLNTADMVLRDLLFQDGVGVGDPEDFDPDDPENPAKYVPSVGFKLMHDQGLNFNLDNCKWGNLNYALDIRRGGCVHVDKGRAQYCDLFADVIAGGDNTLPTLTVDRLRFENAGYQLNRYMKLLRTAPLDTVMVSFDRVGMGDGAKDDDLPDAAPYLFDIGALTHLTVNGCEIKQPLYRVSEVETPHPWLRTAGNASPQQFARATGAHNLFTAGDDYTTEATVGAFSRIDFRESVSAAVLKLRSFWRERFS